MVREPQIITEDRPVLPNEYTRFLFPPRGNFISLTAEESSLYHTWPDPSCSDLKLLDESPVAYYERKVAKTAPPRSGEALSYGTL